MAENKVPKVGKISDLKNRWNVTAGSYKEPKGVGGNKTEAQKSALQRYNESANPDFADQVNARLTGVDTGESEYLDIPESQGGSRKGGTTGAWGSVSSAGKDNTSDDFLEFFNEYNTATPTGYDNLLDFQIGADKDQFQAMMNAAHEFNQGWYDPELLTAGEAYDNFWNENESNNVINDITDVYNDMNLASSVYNMSDANILDMIGELYEGGAFNASEYYTAPEAFIPNYDEFDDGSMDIGNAFAQELALEQVASDAPVLSVGSPEEILSLRNDLAAESMPDYGFRNMNVVSPDAEDFAELVQYEYPADLTSDDIIAADSETFYIEPDLFSDTGLYSDTAWNSYLGQLIDPESQALAYDTAINFGPQNGRGTYQRSDVSNRYAVDPATGQPIFSPSEVAKVASKTMPKSQVGTAYRTGGH